MAASRRRAVLFASAAVLAAALGLGLGLGLGTSGGGAGPGGDGAAASGSHGTTSSTGPPGHVGTTTPKTSGTRGGGEQPHVLLLVLENHGYHQIVGNPTAPYLNQLMDRYGLATASYADTHPSLPNYIDLVSGSTQGITSDCADCTANGTQLVDQLHAAGIGWGAYLESMPGPCFTGTGAPPYDKNHNPFAHTPHLVHDATRCAHVVPYSRLARQLADGTAPAFIWVTPNVTHDMHTGSVREGDRWLSQQLPRVLHSSWYAAGGIVIITFDEGQTATGCCGGAAGGHIATIVVSAATPRHARMATPVDHAGVLRTIEELYRLPFLGAAARPSSGTLLPLLGRRPG